MKLTIEAKLLSTTLNRVCSCVKKVDDILGHILLDADPDGGLTISGTDLEREVKIRIPAQVDQPGQRTAHAGLLTRLINGSSQDVSLSLESGILNARCGRTEFEIPSLHPDSYYSGGASITGDLFTFSGNEFQQALSDVVFCATDQLDRPFLSGVHVYARHEGCWIWVFVASNGKKMVERCIEAPENGERLNPLIYPMKSVAKARTVFSDVAKRGEGVADTEGEVEIFVSRGKLTMSSGNISFVSSLVAGTFPQSYRKNLELGPHVIKINREELLDGINAVSSVYGNVGVTCLNGTMKLATHRTKDHAQGRSEIPCEGELPYGITVEACELIPVLNALQGEEITLHFQGDSPIVMFDERKGVTACVSPMSGVRNVP